MTIKKVLNKIEKMAMPILEKIHLKIFGHPMSDTMRIFLGNLSWSFFGGIISAGILAVINIMAGRVLGPEEFGRFGLVLAMAYIFIIPMTMGIDVSSVYYISKSKNKNKKREYTHSALNIFLMVLTITSLLLFCFSKTLSEKIHIDNLTIKIAILFAIFLSFKNFFDSLARGWKIFKWQAVVRLLEVNLVLCLFIILILSHKFNSFTNYIGIIMAGYIISVSLIGFRLIKNFQFTFKKASKILRYGKYVVLGSISGVILNSVDKIFINKYLGIENLGIYNAYSTASMLVVAQVVVIFINVFFPMLSAIKNRKTIIKKINKLFVTMVGPLFIFFYGLIMGVILLFGKKYPLDFVLVGEFSLLTILTGYFSILWWFIASIGKTGIKFTSLHGIIMGLIFISLVLSFSTMMNLHSVVLFLIVTNLYAIIIGNFKGKNISV